MAAGIAAVAPQFVPVVLGNQWRPAIPVMQVLAVWGGVRAFGANVGPVYKSTGRPDIEARIQALKVIFIIVIIYPAAELFGLAGVASAIVMSSSITLPAHFYYVLSITQGRIVELLKLIAYPLVGSIGMAGSVVILDTYVLVGTDILNLISLITSGIILYFALMFLFEHLFDAEFTELSQLVKQNI
jgi:O-antigen/teichoic acid export membrane protein